MATAVVLATAGITLTLVLLLAGGDGEGDGAAVEATGNAAATATGTPFEAVDADGQAIVDLGRQSVEALPMGEWPALYDEFTQEFRDRCPLSEFVAAGQADAANLGDLLGEIRFKYLIDVNLAGDTATAVIVGALADDEYTIETAFVHEESVWKIAPAAGTTGCSGFNRLSG
ncbi:MAG TPA: hypothetical protein VIT93_00195 [Dehalococcoidia bacterium]